jgi:ferredoxin
VPDPAESAIPESVKQAAAAAGCPAHAHTNGNGHANGAVVAHPESPAATPTTMRVRVDRDLCQGHATCATEAPDVFAISPKDHKVILKVSRPSADQYDRVRAAAHFCPNRVIRIDQ